MSGRDAIASAFERHGPSLRGYLTRLVAREDVAEELVQQTALKALEQATLPGDDAELRAWCFRVATNLAFDHLRKHATWRESVLVETQARAKDDAAFLAESHRLAGSPEVRAIAKDHLAVCFSCTLRTVRPHEAAALLLKEVYDFTVEEVAEQLEATGPQVKGWIQSARAQLRARYDTACALVARQGVCFQCVQLDNLLQGGQGDPLAETKRDLDARLAILRERRDAPLGPWHRQMMRLVDEVLGGGPPPKPRS